MKKVLLSILLILMPMNADAAIVEEVIEYKDGETTLEGYLVYDGAVEGKRPGVIVVHDWMGFGEVANERAKMLADLGYIALAVDIYGKGVRPKNNSEAGQQATLYKGNRTLMRERVNVGLDTLKNHPLSDENKLAAMGYCFGGTVALELARSGSDVKGVVSFHGGLDSPSPSDAQNIKGKVLALHGADDPHVPEDEVKAFQKEMREAGVDWQMIYYSGAVHAFTNKKAGNDNSKGAAYNASADARSWEHMKIFFDEIF